MPEDVLAYLLLAVDVLVVALVFALPVLGVFWLLGVRRPRPRPTGAAGADAVDTQVAGTDAAGPGRAETPAARTSSAADDPPGGGRLLRRCESCGLLWKGRPGHDLGRVSLRLRRWVRRRRRRLKRDVPAWARRQGWSRCPRCLSGRVRASGAEAARR